MIRSDRKPASCSLSLSKEQEGWGDFRENTILGGREGGREGVVRFPFDPTTTPHHANRQVSGLYFTRAEE